MVRDVYKRQEEDRLAESGSQFGSTRRGIAYAYGDKYMKKTLRMGDLAHLDDSVKKRLTTIAAWKSLTMELSLIHISVREVISPISAASAGASTPRDLFTATPSANSFE